MTLRRTVRVPVLILAASLALSACQRPAELGPADFPNDQPLGCTEVPSFRQEGIASWYGRTHQGKQTASGESFDMNAATAAHRRLPLGTSIKVTNLDNGRTTTLTVNDRGPYVRGYILDVSNKGARDLGFIDKGTARVRIEAGEKTQC